MGSLRALRDGRELALGGPQPRLLLAFLVHARGREVGRGDLTAALWGGRPPASADIALRSLISKLRGALGVSLLDGRLPARVRVPQGTLIDVAEFGAGVLAAEAALARGDATAAIECVRSALALDGGPFAAGLEAEWLEEARREQQALRERALEVAARAALTAADADLRRAGVNAALELCHEQPYHERAHLVLMRLLAAEGERARALSVYDELRRRLRDELGLVPSYELRALHTALVAEDGEPAPSPADGIAAAGEPVARPLGLPPALASALRAGVPRGRTEPLAELERHRRAAAASGRLVLVAGESGVGKTSLVAAAAAAAHRASATALYGRCDPEPLHAFAPFAEALGPAAAAGRLAGLPAWARSYLSLLLPELAGAPPAGGGPLGDGDLARVRLFQAVAAAIVSLRSGEQAVMIILDDLHWADASTLLLLRYLAAEAPRLPLLILGTLRDPDPDQGDRLPETVAILRRRSPLHTIALRGLEASAVRELISAWAGAPSSESLASELTAHTRGNPFYLTALLDHLRATRVIDTGPLPERLPADALESAPETVREAVAERVSRLRRSAVAVLDAAAILGPQFALEEAAAIAEVELETALAALESTTAAGLTHELGRGVYEFAHALIRAALLERVGATRRAFLHMRAGQVIERDADREERVGELALHFGQALTREAAPRALRYARAAGERAAARYAFAEAADQYDLALRALAATDGTTWLERYELLMALGAARYRSAGTRPAEQAFDQALEIAADAHDPERMALAALGTGLERFLGNAGGVDARAVAALARADEALGEVDTPLKARVRTQLLLERTFVDSLPERQARTAGLTALARRLDDPTARLEAFVARAVALWHPAHTEQLLAELPEMLTLTDRLERPDVALHLNCTAFGWALELGLIDELDRRLAAAAEAADRLRTPIHRTRVRGLEITRRLLRGELEAAEADIAALLPDARELFPEVAAEVELMWSFMLARQRGGAERLLPMLDAALELAPATTALRAIAAEASLLCGEADRARRHLSAISLADVREDFLMLGALSLAGTVAADLGDAERAAGVHERLLPWAERNVIIGLAGFHRPVAVTLGVLEHALGQSARALERLRTAARRAAGLGIPAWQANALYEQGRVLAEMGRDDEAARAFARAAEVAERYGGKLPAQHARAGLELALASAS